MSIKIFNGFYLDSPIEKVIPILKDIKAALEPMMMEKARNAMCDKLTTLCFRILEGETEGPRVPSSCSMSKRGHLQTFLRDKKFLDWAAYFVEVWAEESENPASPPMDYSEDCCVSGKVFLFPHEGKTYGIAHGPNAFCRTFLQMPQIHDFCYWNSVDRLSDITTEEWTARGSIWNELTPSFWTADDGFTYTLFNAQRFQFTPPTVPDVDAWLKENRNKLICRRANGLLREQLAKSTPQEDMSEVRYVLHLDKLAQKEIKDKTNLSAWAISKAAEEIPHDFSGMLQLLS